MLIDEMIPHKLAEGTDDERSVPWHKHANLGENHDHLFGALAKLHTGLLDLTLRQGAPRMQNPLLITIECLWLTWCYASVDVARCRSTIDALTKRIEALERRFNDLEQPLS